MIDSFKIDVPAAELKTHFEARMQKHKEELEKLEGNRVHLIGKDGGDPTLVKKLRQQVKLMTYVVNHLPAEETYRLSLHELDGLHVLKDLLEE